VLCAIAWAVVVTVRLVWHGASVSVKAQIQPNAGKYDPHAVQYDRVPGVHDGHISALPKQYMEL
jgi:hypothetical protein